MEEEGTPGADVENYLNPSITRTWWTRCLASWGLPAACPGQEA